MKKNRKRWVLKDYTLKKYFTMIKLISFFFLLGIVQVFATDGYSQQTRISINLDKAKLVNVLDEIENKSEYYFLYNKDYVDVEQIVDVKVENQSVKEIMDLLLESTGLKYSIINQQIVLTNANKKGTSQQEKTIKGKVLDTSGLPLPGVSIAIKGTTTGTITDFDGNYTLSGVSSSDVLAYAFVGMISQSIEVGAQSMINVTMKADAIGIEEVVAIGYGTAKRITLTGAIASVNSDQILTTSNESVANMLSGKVAGLRVLQRTAEPGEFDTDIDIRGMGTPLIIIDGVPSGSINHLDPNDIESLTILKDASAAAVYGVRAANGVVLVKTKRGTKGKTEFSYEGTYGVQVPLNSPETMSAVQWMEVKNEQQTNQRRNPIFSEEEIAPYRNGTLPSTDWYNMVVAKTAPKQQHNLSATGRTEKMGYFVSMGYMEQEGFWKSGDLDYNKISLRSNLTMQLTKNLEGELLISRITDTKNQPFNDWKVLKGAYMQIPTVTPFANNNPAYMNNVPDGNHPLAYTDSDLGGFKEKKHLYLTTTFALNYKVPFIDGLKARGMYSRDYTTTTYRDFQKAYSLYEYTAESDTYKEIPQVQTNLKRAFKEQNNELMQFSLNYEKTIADKHNIKVLALYEESTRSVDNFYAKRMFDLDIPQLYAGIGGDSQDANADPNNIYDEANKGLVGRLNYDFESKYIAEFSCRYDGSSKFLTGHQWGFFPAASVGWRVSEEAFFENIHQLAFISSLKFRASHGELGDDGNAAYQYVVGYDYPKDDKYHQIGSLIDGNFINGMGFRDMPNFNLTWYTSKTTDIGFDATLWDGKLSIEADYFVRKRSGILGDRGLSLPTTLGANLPKENLNSDRTAGYDLSLRHNNSIGDFAYYAYGNVSFTRTETTSFARSEYVDSYDNWKNNKNGRFNDLFWGYGANGIFLTRDEVVTSPKQDDFNRTFPGNPKLEDWNGDGVINAFDEHVIGMGLLPDNKNALPLVNFGLAVGGNWKGFDLDLLFQGGGMTFMKYTGQISDPLPWGRNSLELYADRWRPAVPGDINGEWIPGNYQAIASTKWNANSEAAIHNARYLRLKSAEIGYTFSSSILKKIGLKSARVFTNGYNLFTWDGIEGWDPEKRGDLEYMNASSYNLGVNIKF